MPQTSELLIDDLIALYLKYNRIEWARTHQSTNNTIIIETSVYTDLQFYHVSDPLWHNGVKTTKSVQTNEELRRFIGENPKVLWKDLTKEQQLTLLDCCQLIKEWQECPTLPAVIAWYLSQYANYDQQKDFYQEVQNSPGGLERRRIPIIVWQSEIKNV